MKRNDHEKKTIVMEKFYTGGAFEISSFRVSRRFSYIKIAHQGHFEHVAREICFILLQLQLLIALIFITLRIMYIVN